MKYYVLEFDDNFSSPLIENIPFEYEGISLNLGTKFDELQKISLIVKNDNLPNCIPNNRRYLYFDEILINVLIEFNFNKYQLFDVEVRTTTGVNLNTKYKLVNILNIVNCIDRQNSILEIDEDEDDDDLNIVDIKSLKLDYSKINDEIIFRLQGFETLLIFREDIAQAIVNKHIRGVQFINAEGYIV